MTAVQAFRLFPETLRYKTTYFQSNGVTMRLEAVGKRFRI